MLPSLWEISANLDSQCTTDSEKTEAEKRMDSAQNDPLHTFKMNHGLFGETTG